MIKDTTVALYVLKKFRRNIMENERTYYTVDELKEAKWWKTGSRNEDIIALADMTMGCIDRAKCTVYKEERLAELNQAKRILVVLRDKARD
jgi:hypothetical protein